MSVSELLRLVLAALAFLGGCSALGSQYDLIPPIQLDAHLNYDFKGSTMMGRNYAKLTADFPDQRGYIVSNAPGLLPENFELTMEFQVGGGGRNLYGDGMVLWILQDEPSEGSMFGLNEYYKGAAIAIDTYRNGKSGRVFPRLVLMKNDGNTPYDKDNDGNLNEIGGCTLRGIHDNRRQDYSSLRVSYSQLLKMLIVEVNYRNAWEQCDFTTNLDLGPVSRIAVSAATGELVERHVVRSLKLTDYGTQAPPAVLEKQHERAERSANFGKKVHEHHRVGTGFSFFRTLFKLAMFAAGVYGAFIAYKFFRVYRQKMEDNKYKLI